MPCASHRGAGGVDPGGQALPGQAARGGRIVGEGQRDRAGHGRQLGSEDYETGARAREAPGHRVVLAEVLPQVGGTKVTGTGLAEAGSARQAQAPTGALREQRSVVHPGSVVASAGIVRGGIIGRVLLQVTGQQSVDPHVSPGQRVLHQHDITVGVRHHFQGQLVGMLGGSGMHDRRQRHRRVGDLHLVAGDLLDLMPPATASDDEPQVTNLRLADGRPEDLVDDPLPHRCPDLASAQPGRDQILGASGHERPRSSRRNRGSGHG